MINYSHLLLAFCLLLINWLPAQSISGDPQADIRSLRGLSNSEYLETAVDYAVAYSQQGDGAAANKLLSNALLKARISGGRNAAARVHLAYVKGLQECCLTGPNENIAQLRIITSLTKAHNLDRNRVLTGEIQDALRQVNAQATASNVLAGVARLARTLDPSGQFSEELQGATQMAITQQDLENQSAELQDEVRAKEQEIQNLSLAAARERALVEYHKKVADSLYFAGLIDSLTVMQQEQALMEQAATIQLQESELELQESELELQDARSRTMMVIIFSALLGLGLVSIFYLRSRQLNRRLATEKARSEELLLNILPKDVAEELKTTGQVEPRFYELGTVLFTDFVDFSSIAQALPSDRLIKDLDECFQIFDHLAGEFGVEKIKTIGDAYMCIGGVPTPDKTAVRNMIRFALELQRHLAAWNAQRAKEQLPLFQARIGIHTGPVVAGVVGVKKFSYDVWGDTVNIAARMESQSVAGKVNISGTTHSLVQHDFQFTARGPIELKNMAPMDMYFVERAALSSNR